MNNPLTVCMLCEGKGVTKCPDAHCGIQRLSDIPKSILPKRPPHSHVCERCRGTGREPK